ncbi:MAG: winged helix-turn-helix domain-containing protein, partial [Dehalococcoidia bacterium]|nr:winged helix-turn-helix domain-containing protein [Dehalococcoidia bacterium]
MAEFMTFADAAYKLLRKSGEPRHYRWITEEALHRRFIKTRGKTPADTMYAVLYSEIKNEIAGKTPSRFIRTGRGMFSLAEWQSEQRTEQPRGEATEQHYFVFIVNEGQGVHGKLPARQIYECLMRLGVWGIGERTPYRKELRKGSQVVFYQAGKGGQRFIGTATIASQLRRMSESRAQQWRKVGIEPIAYDLELSDIDIWEESKPVIDMMQRLEFIGNK